MVRRSLYASHGRIRDGWWMMEMLPLINPQNSLLILDLPSTNHSYAQSRQVGLIYRAEIIAMGNLSSWFESSAMDNLS